MHRPVRRSPGRATADLQLSRAFGTLLFGQQQAGGELACHQRQRLFVIVVEGVASFGFDEEHPHKPRPTQHRHRQLAARLGQRRQRDRRDSLAACGLSNGRGITLAAPEVADAQRPPARRGEPRRALAHRNFRAEAECRVTAAGDGAEPCPLAVRYQHHGVAIAEQSLQFGQSAVEHQLGVNLCRNRAADSCCGNEVMVLWLAGLPSARHRRPGDRPAIFDLVDIEAAQLHDLAHALLGAGDREMSGDTVEQLAFADRIGETQLQNVLLPGAAVDHHHGRHAAVADILRCLGEELVGECHMALVDIVNMRQVGNVGHAPGIGGGHNRRDDTLEGVANVPKADHDCTSRAPAPGPGVCTKRSVGTKLMQTRSQSVSVCDS